MEITADIGVGAVALGFFAMGLGALVAPNKVTDQFGIHPLGVDGRNEVRAVYGGFGIAIAGVLAWALLNPAVLATICATVAIALVGMAVGRIISMFCDKGMSRVTAAYLGIEVIAAGLLAPGILL